SLPALTIQAGVLQVGGGWPPIAPSRYLAAIDRYGSPALSQPQLATAGEDQRQAADRVLLAAGDLRVRRAAARRPSEAAGCGAGGLATSYRVPPHGLVLEPRAGPSAVSGAALRFGDAAQPLRLPAGAGPLLVSPAAPRGRPPWFVVVAGARVCR